MHCALTLLGCSKGFYCIPLALDLGHKRGGVPGCWLPHAIRVTESRVAEAVVGQSWSEAEERGNTGTVLSFV